MGLTYDERKYIFYYYFLKKEFIIPNEKEYIDEPEYNYENQIIENDNNDDYSDDMSEYSN